MRKNDSDVKEQCEVLSKLEVCENILLQAAPPDTQLPIYSCVSSLSLQIGAGCS